MSSSGTGAPLSASPAAGFLASSLAARSIACPMGTGHPTSPRPIASAIGRPAACARKASAQRAAWAARSVASAALVSATATDPSSRRTQCPPWSSASARSVPSAGWSRVGASARSRVETFAGPAPTRIRATARCSLAVKARAARPGSGGGGSPAYAAISPSARRAAATAWPCSGLPAGSFESIRARSPSSASGTSGRFSATLGA